MGSSQLSSKDLKRRHPESQQEPGPSSRPRRDATDPEPGGRLSDSNPEDVAEIPETKHDIHDVQFNNSVLDEMAPYGYDDRIPFNISIAEHLLGCIVELTGDADPWLKTSRQRINILKSNNELFEQLKVARVTKSFSKIRQFGRRSTL